MVWQLLGSPNQQAIVAAALDRCTFPFDVMLPGLREQAGRTSIPVAWSDLSRYAEALAASDHGHVHEGDDLGHPIGSRARVLGLFWFSGKIEIDTSLERDPELAGEIFLSEAAHAVDMFYLTAAQRHLIWDALHIGDESIEHDHRHGWFNQPYAEWAGEFMDAGGNVAYRDQVGESFMAVFVAAWSDFPVTIPFTHAPTPETTDETRAALTPYFTSRTGTLHDSHRGITPAAFHVTPPNARRCGVCKPGAST
jgi:hypothetical protein